MTPDWVARHYRLDAATGVFRREGGVDVAYSDGDAQEDALLSTLQRVDDRSVFSDDLRRAIVDWPTEYHLSSARANLLRPLDIRASDTVVELGAGCGALTRWLGETGANVVAVEGSARRAAIARVRCAELPNVTVVCDRIAEVSSAQADWVLLIGVLEYARVMATGEREPVQALLAHARTMLAPGGVLVLAIENQLGLKYFNGCAEDHLGVPYFGVDSLYGPGGPVTFGRAELERHLSRAGYARSALYLPFPDYKLPLVIVSPEGQRDAELDLADLVSRTASRDYGGSRWRAFCEPLAWQAIVRNGLVADHANSFLFVAGDADAVARRSPGNVLAWSFNSTRRASYEVASVIARAQDGIRVAKTVLHDTPPSRLGFSNRPVGGTYVAGKLLAVKLLRDAEAADIDALIDDALPWFDLLLAAARNADGVRALPGEFVDAIPTNVVVDGNGRAHLFDLEWRYESDIPLSWVVLRGLALALLGVVNSPWRDKVSIADLAARLYQGRSLAMPADAATTCESWETRFYEAAIGDLARDTPLPAASLLAPITGRFEGVFPLARKLSEVSQREQAERMRLEADTQAIRAMLASERDGHAATIEKLRSIDEQAHFVATRLSSELHTAREALGAERRLHAEDVSKHAAEVARLADEAARLAVDRDEQARQREAVHAAREAVQAALDAASAQLIQRDVELSSARARIDAQAQELAGLLLERSTFGARIGRALTATRNRLFPVSSRRGRMVTMMNRFAIAVHGEGMGSAIARTRRLIGRRLQPPRDAAIDSDELAGGSRASPPELARWIAANEPDAAGLEALRQRAGALAYRPLISVIVPVYRVPAAVLAAAIASLQHQTYDRWEACVACGEDERSENWTWLAAAARGDPRVRPFLLPNAGISGNSNAALARAEGEFVALLDHDDMLSPQALQAMVERLNDERDLDFLYTDKDSVDESGTLRQNALFKPEWSPEMLYSVNYLTHLNVMRRDLLNEIGGWRPETDGAQDWDLFLRLTEKTTRIARVTGLHYHWRIIATSVATGLAAKPYAAAAQVRCQLDRLQRLGWPATAVPHQESGFHVQWLPPAARNVEVVVHAAAGRASLRHCLDGLRAANLDDVVAIRVLVSEACPDREAVERDFAAVWQSRLRFQTLAAPLSTAIVAVASEPGAPVVVLVDGRARYVGATAIEEVARWVVGAPPIAWAAGIALALDEHVLEAGRVATEHGASAPLFRGVPLHSWGWFGGPLWYRNVSAASPFVFAAQRSGLAALPADDSPFDAWWTRACATLRGGGRRGLVTPHARVWFEGDALGNEAAPFDDRMKADPYFHPAFCSASPLRLMP